MTPPSKFPSEVVTNPDPTTAVKEALELAIKNLSHEIDLRFEGDKEARQVAARSLDNILDVMAQKMLSVKEQVGQQAVSNKELVTQQAASNKELVNQARELTALALTAALQTQEKSAAETRTFIQESIRQLKNGVDEGMKALNEKIEVVREQVTRMGSRLDLAQGGLTGTTDNRRENREDTRDTAKAATDNRSFIIAALAVAVALAALFFGLKK